MATAIFLNNYFIYSVKNHVKADLFSLLFFAPGSLFVTHSLTLLRKQGKVQTEITAGWTRPWKT